MANALWQWSTSGAGLSVRIILGVTILGFLALVDWRRHGPQAQRWREYGFLLLVVLVAMGYGILNDQITSRISWEYYYYGKGLAERLGDRLPPETGPLSWEAAKIGMQATWSAGLLVGVALLIANNPRRNRRQIRFVTLFRLSLGVIVAAAGMAAMLGIAGSLGWLTVFSEDFRQMLQHDEMRPRRFMAVFGIHLGGYLGALIGALIAVGRVLHRRRGTR